MKTITITPRRFSFSSAIALFGLLSAMIPLSAFGVEYPPPLPVSITAISPSSGLAGTKITVTGQGFTPTGNRISFAGVNNAVIKLSSPDGTTLAFAIPATPCDQIKGDICIAKVLDPGTYLISVENTNGISNTLAFTVISSPPSVGSAQTQEALVASLQEQIKALQEKIQALAEGKPLPTTAGMGTGRPLDNSGLPGFAPGTAGSGSLASSFTQSLRLGLRSDAVRELQQSLASDPSLYPEGLVTGYYGSLTEQAVKRFQAKYGIVSSGDANTTGYGLVGPKTNAKLKEVFGTTPSLFPPAPASADAFIKALTKGTVPAPDCVTITDPFSQSSCIQQKAIQDKDVLLCSQITSSYLFISRDTCVSGVAQAKKDASLCASIVNPDIKKSCEDMIKNPPPSTSPPFSLNEAKLKAAALTAAVSRLFAQAGDASQSSSATPPPPASSLLSSLAIDPKEYTLGQTLTGNLTLQNQGQSAISASFRSELTRDNTLVWSKDYDNVSVAVGTTNVSLDTIFGFTPTIPNDPAYVGNWVLTIKRKDAGTSERVSAGFTIKVSVIAPLTLTLSIDPKEYELGQVLQGNGSVVNPNPQPVTASFKAELFQGTISKWSKEFLDVPISVGTTNFTLNDVFGSEPRIPNDPRYVGEWKLTLIQTGQLPAPGARAETSFTIAMQKIESKIFVPQNFVPLSTFVKADARSSFSLPVRSDILFFLAARPTKISIAYQTPQGINYLTPSRIDHTGGKVYAIAPRTGYYTVVSDAFTNDFPIVTHWDQSLNGGKGGPRIGAVDPLGIIDVDPQTGEGKQESYIFDRNPDSPYQYATDKYAFFSGDPLNPSARVPSYERYIGEDYAIFKLTDLFAIWVSDQVLQKTGYPVINKNYRGEVGSALPIRIQQNIPAFQVVHAYRIAIAPDKPSLATFLLPPKWVSKPANPYAVLFNGFYDIHEMGFKFYGVSFMSILADLQNQGYGSSVGILWNGGGANGTRTLNRSAYDNASLLFSKATSLLGINPHKVVMVGISRGGLTALEMAANPYHNNYSVKYALAYAPAVKYGEHLADFHNPSYPAVLTITGGAETGYKYAWRQEWKNPVTGGLSGIQLAIYNLLGTSDRHVADSLSPWSDQQITALKNKGTKVLLSAPTHDIFMPYSLYIKYTDKLRAAGVPLRFEIGYRFGHNDATDAIAYAKLALQRVLLGDNTFEIGTYHYKRKSEAEWNISVPFTPSYQPVFAELPKEAAWGETVSMTIVGGVGTMYDMKILKINDDLWTKQERIEKIGNAIYSLRGSFDAVGSVLGSALQSKVEHIPVPNTLATGYYIYELSYSIDGGVTWIQIPPDAVPQPHADKQPTLQIMSEEPMIDGGGIVNLIAQYGRAWGLSSDILFNASGIQPGFVSSPISGTSSSLNPR